MGLSNRTSTGPDAKAKVNEYFLPRGSVSMSPNHVRDFIAWLDHEGYIIVPKGHQAPARRGKVKPPKYTGPDFIGQSHVARLAAG